MAPTQQNSPLTGPTASPRPYPLQHPDDAVSGALVGSSIISILCLLVVIFSYLRWRRLRRHPGSLIMMRSALDLLFCIELVASHLYHRNTSNASDDDCQGFTFVTQALAIGAEIYGALLSLDLLLSLSNPFTNFKRNARWFHGIALAGVVALSLPVLVARDHGRPLYGRDNALAICWIHTHAPDGTVDYQFYYLFVGPLIALYLFALIALLYAQRRLRQGLPETLDARLSIFRSSLRFVLSYSLYWLLAAAVFMGLNGATDAPPEALDLVLAFALGSRGIVTCVVWLMTYGRDLHIGRTGLTMPPKGDKPSTNSLSGTLKAAASEIGFFDEESDLRPYLSNALRKEILYYTSLGIARGTLRAMKEKSTDGVMKGNLAYNRLMLSRAWEERGLFTLEKANRRRNSMQSMTASIAVDIAGTGLKQQGKGATNANTSSADLQAWLSNLLNPRAISPDSRGHEGGLGERLLDKGASGSGVEMQPQDVANDPALRLLVRAASAEGIAIPPTLMPPDERLHHGHLHHGSKASDHSPEESPTGSQTNLSGMAGVSRHEDESKGAATRHIARLLRAFLAGHSSSTDNLQSANAGSSSPLHQPAPSPTSASANSSSKYVDGSFEFLDYEPHLFARMRELSGIDNLDYVRSLSKTSREKFSEGASGAFLYFSTCERFIVKTLTESEVNVLLRMLHDYVSYMERHPHSLVTRFYGCHAITMYGTTVYFAVMQNIMQSAGATIHERYDLKGSWVNRHRVPLERGQKTDCRYCGQKFKVGHGSSRVQCPARPNHPHEPNTVLRDADWNYRLRLRQEVGQALGDMIVRDTEFLRRHGIMDYSLLLGIHRNKYKLVDTSSHGQAHHGGLAGAGATIAGFGTAQGLVSMGPGNVMQSEDEPQPSLLLRQPSMGPGPGGMLSVSNSVDAISSLSSPITGHPSAHHTHPYGNLRDTASALSPGGVVMQMQDPGSAARARLQLQQCDSPAHTPSMSPASSTTDLTGFSLNAVQQAGPQRGAGGLAALGHGAMAIRGAATLMSPGLGPMPLATPPADTLMAGPLPTPLMVGQPHPGMPATPAHSGLDEHGAVLLRLDEESARQRGPITPFFAEHRGGLRAIIVEGPGIYYLGIIDVLQEYTWAKWLERQIKTLLMCLSPEGVSVVAPNQYASRFRSRVIAQLIEGYEWDAARELVGHGEWQHSAWDEEDFMARG